VLIHDLTHYSKQALYNAVETWLDGGEPSSGKFAGQGAVTPPCKAGRLELRQGSGKQPIHGLENWVSTTTLDRSTFGLQWKDDVLEPWSGNLRCGAFPEYSKLNGHELDAVDAKIVPDETGLKTAVFPPAEKKQSYTSPESADSVWMKPGPKAGPFTVTLADGSVVTYSWYRVIDQPSLQDADLTDAEKERLQAVVEKIQSQWTMEKEYLPPPHMGTLATLDAALIVEPPKGLEVGYVPIVTRQAPQ
jgi:hypothetical protein